MIEWHYITLVLAGFLVLLAVTSIATVQKNLEKELARKLVHMGMGLICLSFPFLFQNTLSVTLLGGIAVVSIVGLKYTKWQKSAGAALFSVERVSYGELLFPIAIAWLFHISQAPYLTYSIPILILTFADSAGALIGKKFGKHHYQTRGANKSVEGSLAVFITSFLFTFLPIFCLSQSSFHAATLVSALVASFSTVVEGFSGKGSDNILLPVGCYFLLEHYLQLPSDELWTRTLLTITLLFLFLISMRKHNLNGGATLAAGLFSFACYLWGGLPTWISLVTLYCFHLLFQPNSKTLKHDIEVVLFLATTPVLWLTLPHKNLSPLVNPTALSILALSLSISMIHIMLHSDKTHKYRLLTALSKGMIGLAPVLLISPSLHGQTIYILFLAHILTISFYFFYWIRGQSDRSHTSQNWWEITLISLLSSSMTYLWIS